MTQPFDPNLHIKFEKLDSIKDRINPRYWELCNSVNLNYKFDPDIPEIVDTTKYGPRSFYMNNKKIKRAGVEVNFTPEMIEELRRCKEDILYFAERYYTIRTLDHGKIKIPLRDYQKFWLRVYEIEEIRNRVWLACRQSAKSTTLTVEIAHRMIFNEDFEYVILANKGNTAREIFSRVRMAYEQLPLWMQIGVLEWNKGSVKLENDSRVFAASSSSDSVRGFSPNEVLLDEAAFVKNDEEFMASVFPTISSGSKSRMTQVSTPNGPRGIFYRDYSRAAAGKNGYFSFAVPWHFVPGRDEAWKAKTIEDTSRSQFLQEQDLAFLGAADGLIDGEVIERMTLELMDPILVNDEEMSGDEYRVFELPQNGKSYILTADTAEGKGKDSSTFSVFYVSERPFKQVMSYKSNQVSQLIFPNKMAKVAELYNMALIIPERNNTSGGTVCYKLYYDLEYPNVYMSGDGEMDIGVHVSHSVRSLGTNTLRSLCEKGGLVVRDERTLNELANFRLQKNGKYAAPEGDHDDMVQNLWIFSWYSAQSEFEEAMKENIYNNLYKEELDTIENLKITSSEPVQYDPFAVGAPVQRTSSFW
ncbi:terminase large subunit [Agrobacterium phage OLIVR5]|uniref:Terminase large subunit n=1 Tax=Agrobacterium phage OLIVR5 TaxID=2723773 RepID=A0A858MTQ2_9CAUD|nr:terminase large subunit [Agrobacterium phage OLIVR5]QIW87791.1 terminase large subunit [Agrobacterium phage OLIVR5]QIW88056.1 terminase large subunit [Agrobacterium phage OLIVR6]